MFVSSDLYSFYDSANNYWDFDRSDNIVDNVTSRKSIPQGIVSTTRSPAGTGLFVKKGTEIYLNKYNMAGIESSDISIACLDPTRCEEGFTISVLIKVTGTKEALKKNIFLFGNRISEEHKGWSVGVLDNKLQIVVATNEDVCSLIDVNIMANIWFQLAFSWKDPKSNGQLKVFIDHKSFYNSSDVQCKHLPLSRSLQQTISIGSTTGSTDAEYDNLAVWYKQLTAADITAPWIHMKGAIIS